MADTIHQEELLTRLNQAGREMLLLCRNISPSVFFQSPEGKWNAAEQIKHLIISANSTRTAYKLPKFILHIYVGKPNRPSRSYEALKEKYYQKLDAGGRASKRFIPSPASQAEDQFVILNKFEKAMQRLQDTISRKWNDSQLDQYIAPHPLLGKITHRELIYFTIFHTEHHQQSIMKMVQPGPGLA